MGIPDNDDLHADYERRQHVRRSRYPKCRDCDEYIESSHYYDVDGYILCKGCMHDRYRKSTEDYLDSYEV